MPNLDLLNQPLEAQEDPGIPTIDPRFMEISGKAQKGEFEEAGTEIEALFQEDIYDIRLIGYYLYWVIHEDGMVKLKDIVETINHLLTECWDAIGPGRKKEKHTDKSLSWLFQQLLKTAEYEEEKNEEVYQSWLSQCTSDNLQEAIDALEALRKNLSMVLEEKPPEKALEQLTKFNQWVKEFHRVIYQAEEEAKAAEEEEEEEEAEEGGEGGETPSLGGAPGGGGSYAEGSYHLHQLQRKLKAFEVLVRRDELAKASLVADDIANIIANFDPTVYFPQLFSAYFAHLSQKIEAISSFWENKESLPWQVMEQLYRTDLDAFVDF